MSERAVSLNGIPYVKMRLAEIASGDYRACGFSAEELARDAFKELIALEQHTASPDVYKPIEDIIAWTLPDKLNANEVQLLAHNVIAVMGDKYGN